MRERGREKKDRDFVKNQNNNKNDEIIQIKTNAWESQLSLKYFRQNWISKIM